MARGGVWSPAAGVYLVMLLGALACGLWPDAIHPGNPGQPDVLLPVLPALAVAQTGFFLLAWPVVSVHRRRLRRSRYWAEALAEVAVLLLVSMPWLACGAWLGDGGWADVARTLLHVLAVALLALSLGAWARRGGGAWLAAPAGMLVFAGLPGIWYISADLLLLEGHTRIWALSPALQSWSAARSASGAWPEPFWPVACWAGAAAILAVGEWARPQPPQPSQT
jgi:hypothetical protein